MWPSRIRILYSTLPLDPCDLGLSNEMLMRTPYIGEGVSSIDPFFLSQVVSGPGVGSGPVITEYKMEATH